MFFSHGVNHWDLECCDGEQRGRNDRARFKFGDIDEDGVVIDLMKPTRGVSFHFHIFILF
jgi:hypothetical protein